MIYIGLNWEKHEKNIFLSETIRPRALIFGMMHHVVVFRLVFFSNYNPGAKNGHRFYISFYREKHEKTFLSETIKPRALIFGMKHHLVDLYQVSSNWTPGVKMATPQGSHALLRLIYGET